MQRIESDSLSKLLNLALELSSLTSINNYTFNGYQLKLKRERPNTDIPFVYHFVNSYFSFKAATTHVGTSSLTPPPYFATSFTMLELKNEY